MVYEDVEVGDPGPGQVLLRQTAIGVNYIDIYHRSGLYPMPMPRIIGSEGCGVVEAVGKGAKGVKKGDRVMYTGAPVGSYATWRLFAGRPGRQGAGRRSTTRPRPR